MLYIYIFVCIFFCSFWVKQSSRSSKRTFNAHYYRKTSGTKVYFTFGKLTQCSLTLSSAQKIIMCPFRAHHLHTMALFKASDKDLILYYVLYIELYCCISYLPWWKSNGKWEIWERMRKSQQQATERNGENENGPNLCWILMQIRCRTHP